MRGGNRPPRVFQHGRPVFGGKRSEILLKNVRRTRRENVNATIERPQFVYFPANVVIIASPVGTFKRFRIFTGPRAIGRFFVAGRYAGKP